RSSLFLRSDSISSRSCSSRRRRWSTFCASAWSFQKSGWAARASSRVSSSFGRAASKIAPKVGSAFGQVLVATHQFVNGRHVETVLRVFVAKRRLLYTSSFREYQHHQRHEHRRVRENVTSASVERRCLEKSYRTDEHIRTKDLGLHEHAPVGIDNPADPGVGRSHQIAPLLDRPHCRLPEMLVRRGRLPEPGIIGNRREQLAAASYELTHESGIDDLITDRRADPMFSKRQ